MRRLARALLAAALACGPLAAPAAMPPVPYPLWLGYSFDSRNSLDVAAAHELEAQASATYEQCAHAASGAAALRPCEIAYREAIAAIPHATFRAGISGGPSQLAVAPLVTVPVAVATDPGFDRYFSHLDTNDAFRPTGLVAVPGRCDVRVATTGAPVSVRALLCAALGTYFTTRLHDALALHAGAAFDLLAAGVRTKGSPYDVALAYAGMSSAFAQRLAVAGFDVNAIDASGRTPLQREVDRVRSVAVQAQPCVVLPGGSACTVRRPNPAAVQALLDAGARVDERALELAARSGDAFVVQQLVRRLPGSTRAPEVLRRAIAYGPGAVVQTLLDAGWSAQAPLGAPGCAGCTPLEVAIAGADGAIPAAARGAAWSTVRRTDADTMAAALLAHGADPNVHAGAPLRLALGACDGIAVLKTLLDHGAVVAAGGLLGLAQRAPCASAPAGRAQLPAVLTLLRSRGATS
jgi:hypothetical protein